MLFDINRFRDGAVHQSGDRYGPFPADRPVVRRYGRSLVTNTDRESIDVVERSIRAGPDRDRHAALGLAWQREMFSLSHIALPFPLDDEVYGRSPRSSSLDLVRLGTLSPRGEKAV